MNTLIVSEKPSVAGKIAAALSEGKAKRISSKSNVSYYEIDNGADKIYVVAAVGHVFTIKQSEKNRDYPVLKVEWAPSYQVNKSSDFTKKYLDVIEKIAPKCEMFINACDYDIEGTVIGTNIIRFYGNLSMESAKRMKFSTTTNTDLIKSYKNLLEIDMNNFYAGEARHILDWIWGINLSRALTRALHGWQIGRGNTLSIGRVQGPTLGILAKKELEIFAFVPKDFWRVALKIKEAEFLNKRGDIFEKNEANSAYNITLGALENGIVESIEAEERSINPYPPFDLTALQIEASRVCRYDPTRTLAIAQSLYERSYISYPRTSSQKLPESIGLKNIIELLSKNNDYRKEAEQVISKANFRPIEGKKSDEAHPAIYPTGIEPNGLSDEEKKLYDIIVRRFISCFCDPAKVDRLKVTAKFDSEVYVANGARIKSKGWLEVYPFVEIGERELPKFVKNEKIIGTDAQMRDLVTQPPKRHTKAGLIAELERHELGTKATRAAIIDTLTKRGYISTVSGSSLGVTKFGMSVYDALKTNSSMIVEEATTRRLEEDMEGISKGSKREDEVIEEGKQMLLDALKAFDANRDKISEAMRVAVKDSSNIGICPKDNGSLVIRRSKAGKTFVGCSNYPNCTNTYSLPQNAKIEPTGETCEHCKTPIIKVIRKGRRPFKMDLDPNCVTKKEWGNMYQKNDTPKVTTADKLIANSSVNNNNQNVAGSVKTSTDEKQTGIITSKKSTSIKKTKKAKKTQKKKLQKKNKSE